ncbi:hypothetical protein HDU96_001689, partial [Phlyctochytrium bullatum]
MLQLTEREINTEPRYQIPGVQLRLLFRDSFNQPSLAVKHAIELAQSNTTIAFIGEYYSGVTIPMALATGSFRILQCSGTATTPELSDKTNYPYFFRTVPSDTNQGIALVEIVKYYGWKKVALITVNSNYGFGIASSFLKAASASNITLLRNEAFNARTNETEIPDFKLQVQSIKQSDARIIIVIGYEIETVYLLREARAQGLVGPNYVWIGTDGVKTMYSLLHDAGRRKGWNDTDRQNIEGMLYVAPNERVGPSKEWEAVDERYKAENNGELPKPNSYFCRDCLLGYALGLKNLLSSGVSLQQIMNRNVTIRATDFAGQSFNGSSGLLVFDQNGDRLPNYVVSNVRNGGLIDALSIIPNSNLSKPIEQLTPVVFPSGSSVAPADGIVFTREAIDFGSGIGIAVLGVYFLGILATLVACVVLIVNRGTAPVKQLSMPFLLVKGAGVALFYLSVVGWLGKVEETGLCLVQQWVGWVGFSLVMQGILPKCWRVFRIFENKRMNSVKYLRDPFLLTVSCIITLINVAILGSWTIIDKLAPYQMQEVTTGTLHYECRSSSYAVQNTFNIILMAYNGCLLLTSIGLAWACRNVHSAYRETNYILYAAQNVLVCSIVVVGLVYGIPSGAYMAILYLRLALMWVAATFVMLATVGRVAFMSIMSKDSVFRKSNKSGGSWGGGAGREGTNSNELKLSGIRRQSGAGRSVEIEDETDSYEENEKVTVNGYGQVEMMLAVKDGNRVLSKWEKKRVVYNPTSRVLGILDPETLVGEMIVVSNSVNIADSVTFEDCVEVNYGNNRVRVLQFTKVSAIERFLEITTPALKIVSPTGKGKPFVLDGGATIAGQRSFPSGAVGSVVEAAAAPGSSARRGGSAYQSGPSSPPGIRGLGEVELAETMRTSRSKALASDAFLRTRECPVPQDLLPSPDDVTPGIGDVSVQDGKMVAAVEGLLSEAECAQ